MCIACWGYTLEVTDQTDMSYKIGMCLRTGRKLPRRIATALPVRSGEGRQQAAIPMAAWSLVEYSVPPLAFFLSFL